mmetsp:Transcript_2627/g.7527  ORF Transcript_2627/g.7527 Transcript_2627/m.7527 type:complete len:216 (-) Transcript_2627:216-863(-)
MRELDREASHLEEVKITVCAPPIADTVRCKRERHTCSAQLLHSGETAPHGRARAFSRQRLFAEGRARALAVAEGEVGERVDYNRYAMRQASCQRPKAADDAASAALILVLRAPEARCSGRGEHDQYSPGRVLARARRRMPRGRAHRGPCGGARRCGGPHPTDEMAAWLPSPLCFEQQQSQSALARSRPRDYSERAEADPYSRGGESRPRLDQSRS